jgi:hypothetical protein
MESLHTFTYVKSLKKYSNQEWTFVNVLTSCHVMPILRRMKFSIVIDVNDLNQMIYSPLFNDDRHIDVHYVLMVDDNREHFKLNQHIPPHGSLSHPRQIASATFISESWPIDPTIRDRDEIYVSNYFSRNI